MKINSQTREFIFAGLKYNILHSPGVCTAMCDQYIHVRVWTEFAKDRHENICSLLWMGCHRKKLQFE